MRRQTVELCDFKREEKAVAYLPTTTRGDEVRVKAKEGSRASSLNGWLLMVQEWPVDEREASQGQRVVDAAAAGMAEKCVVQHGITIRGREFHGEPRPKPKR
jgi:hypothetical protein